MKYSQFASNLWTIICNRMKSDQIFTSRVGTTKTMDASENVNKDEQACIVFDIKFEDIQPKSGKPPARFLEYQQRSQVNKIKSSEEISQKQKQAEERKKAYEKAKIERIKETTEECRKIDEKVNRLGVNTNYFGVGKSDNSKPLSTKEAIMSVKSLSKDFSKISTGIKTDSLFAKNLNNS
ncbi:uncharacterized protein LOC143076756 isoform X1 [Mytilus galloprovincialis]|uniref:uncharacterized protein LOC143076756 isoform X1 n=2 Tax=Mytilus galloprovincialis TaxID=29158 RepID=UPI003F7B47D9